MNTTLIIMAAGIGSRFGTGIKQLAKMAPNGRLSWIFQSMMTRGRIYKGSFCDPQGD
ncbi:hypothetical protein [Clostridium sp. AF50-3]|uniref:hypothetical protein n=1 Tax=Clostridium sp. AF50-3 TaxID=2293021 RepID=UPI0026B58F81